MRRRGEIYEIYFDKVFAMKKFGTQLPLRLFNKLRRYAKENETSIQSVVIDALKAHLNKPVRILCQKGDKIE